MSEVTKKFVQEIPKAELHVHLEGTLEPALKLKLAKRNKIQIKQKTIEEVKESYQFNSLASFLSVYYAAMNVLQTQDDFYELTFSYLKKARKNGVKHVEMFFDPQAHTSRGIPFSTVIEGIYQATIDARSLGIDAELIMCFLRDFSKESARKTLISLQSFKSYVIGVGLDSDEHNNPPLKFISVFEKAVEEGFRITMHCDIDQVDSIEHIKQALEIIGVERIDHGTNIIENPDLINFVSRNKIGLTVCPKSNSFIRPDMKGKEIKELLQKGVKISINSDDPAYFRGYISENYWILKQQYNLNQKQIIRLAKNSFETSWISKEQKQLYLNQVDKFVSSFKNKK